MGQELSFHPVGPEQHLLADGEPMTWRSWLFALKETPSTALSWATLLAEQPFDAASWECPPLRPDLLDEPVRTVLLDHPFLARRAPDPYDFREPFRQATGAIATFTNLGGDSVLVSPLPDGVDGDYGHLLGFVRSAPDALVSALWGDVARAVLANLSAEPLWLSTAGGGVPWLHVRLDRRPKYYRHPPYRRPR